MATRFESNPRWLPGWLSSQEVRDIVSEKGDEVLAAAKALAAAHEHTGAFESSLIKTSGRYKTGRPYARISSSDPAALSIEFGTATMIGLRILGRAIRS